MADASSSEPQTVRLQDYRPPAFLVERVALDVELAPHGTVVRSCLSLRRNPALEDTTAPLRLDGRLHRL